MTEFKTTKDEPSTSSLLYDYCAGRIDARRLVQTIHTDASGDCQMKYNG